MYHHVIIVVIGHGWAGETKVARNGDDLPTMIRPMVDAVLDEFLFWHLSFHPRNV